MATLNVNDRLMGTGDTSDVSVSGLFRPSGFLINTVDPTTQVPVTSGTIAINTWPIIKLNPAGAVTGVILTAGTLPGQRLVLVNISGNSITFAAAGTSNVADGTGAVIAANTSMSLTWDAGSARWYHGN